MALKDISTAAPFVPETKNLERLTETVQQCHGCDLYRNATQAVFGEGSTNARAMFVGEQPGDEEDKQGHPFVGPAGRLLREALDEVGMDRDDVYITNAVKHFKWKPRGKRRLHAKPTSRETAACRPWLESELRAIDPEIVVCLGATAAQSLLGSTFRITRERGKILRSSWAPALLATYHPSAVLRAPDHAARLKMRKELVADLRKVARYLSRRATA